MASFYELSELEIEILLWALGQTTASDARPKPRFTFSQLANLIDRLEGRFC